MLFIDNKDSVFCILIKKEEEVFVNPVQKNFIIHNKCIRSLEFHTKSASRQVRVYKGKSIQIKQSKKRSK